MKNITEVKHNCQFCQYYQHEEVGDSDFGAVYAKEASCSEYYDMDSETEEDIPNFDREIERDCCVLDFWNVLEVDNKLSEKFNEEMNNNATFDKTYSLFKEKYNQ